MHSLAKVLMPGFSSEWLLPRSTGGLRTSILAALSAQDAGQTKASIFPSCFFSNSTAGDSRLASAAQAGAQLPRPQLRFDDPEVAFRDKTTRELMRAMAVFSACRFKLLVANAKPLLRASRAVFGDTAMAALLRPTLFSHFCAGEDLKSMRPTVLRLRRAGVGGILDYVAEEEDPVADPLERPCGWTKPATETPEDSALYERRVDKFIQSIQGSADVQTDGFAALKVTGLAHPLLLRRLSRLLTEIRRLFGRFDLDGSGFISEQEFREVHEQLFTGVAPDFTFDALDPKHEGRVDYISFTDSLSPQEATRLVQRCREMGPLYMAALIDDELLQVERLHDRVQRMAAAAAAHGVRLLVDAEKSTVQPAIDLVVNSAMRSVNTGAHPIVFNTYQCYLKAAADTLRSDLQRARRQGYKLGAKLVRGAYKDWERERAEALGYDSPIQDNKEASDANYNACVRMILQEVQEQDVELVVASHNQSSVENAVAAMHHLGLDPQRSGIFFAQLYGMCDHLTYTLAKGGYRAYKLLPFGTVWEAMEYLLRRVEENTDALGGAAKDLDMNSRGLRQRMWQTRCSAAQAAAQHAHA